jgi:gliding motility-associated-like protein
MRCLIKILFTLLLFSNLKAQLLFYQDTYKGGVTSDGRAYLGFDYLQPDTIDFKLNIPSGATIRKAFLISKGILWKEEISSKDSPLFVNLNNHTLTIDSSCRVTNFYFTGGTYMWGVNIDVTAYIQTTANRLIIPCQNCLLSADTSRHFVYNGFLLVVMYEVPSFPVVNPVIFLNNTPYNTTKSYSLSTFNKINTTKDVGLSVYTVDPDNDSITFNLSSTLGNTYLGSIGINYTSLVPDSFYHYAPGSFYYENNTLFGLKDDNPNNGFDTTDALVNIKNYVANNTQSFVVNTTASIFSGTHDLGYDEIDAFILAYSSQCSARSVKDTTVSYTICSGSNPVTLAVNSNTANNTYSWYATDGSLSTSTTASVTVTPTVTTTYIAYVDSAGCNHTEHFKVNVYSLPQIDSVYTTDIICGNNSILGLATIKAQNGTKPYQYSTVGTNQASPTFSNIPVGTYTVSVTDSLGCQSTTKNFTITQINTAQANFTIQPDTACAPASIYFNNTSNTNFNEWYVNGDSINAQNLNYTFTDTGTYHVTLIGWRNLRMCSDTLTKSVHIKDCPPDSIHITVPNIFSPNADGINDSWQLVISSYQYTVSNYQCTVYDRWGIKVFETSNLSQAWDGRSTGGLACSAGAYFYIIKLTATNSKGVSEQKDFKGYLELVR